MFIPCEARVVRLSQNSDDYKRQVRQLHANIQSLGNVLELIGPDGPGTHWTVFTRTLKSQKSGINRN